MMGCVGLHVRRLEYMIGRCRVMQTAAYLISTSLAADGRVFFGASLKINRKCCVLAVATELV